MISLLIFPVYFLLLLRKAKLIIMNWTCKTEFCISSGFTRNRAD